MLAGEIWVSVPGHEGRYFVSNFGRMRSAKRPGSRGGALKATLGGPDFRRRCRLYFSDGRAETKTVSRIVLESFVGPCPEGMECCHNNGDRLDDRLENLRWGTRKENMGDRRRHGRYATKLTLEDARKIKSLLRTTNMGARRLARMFGVSPGAIWGIASGKTWSDA